MYCEKFQARLDEIWDRRLPPMSDESLCAHASQCDDCQILLETNQRLWSAWRQSEPPSLSNDFTNRVVTQVRQDRLQSVSVNTLSTRVRLSRRAATLLVSAALLFICCLLSWTPVYFASRNSSKVTIRDASTSQTQPSPGKSTSDNDRHADRTRRRPGAPGFALARPQTTNSANAPSAPKHPWAHFTLLIDRPPNWQSVLAFLQQQVASLFSGPLVSSERLPGGLQPVARSVSVTLDLLERVIGQKSIDRAESPPAAM